MSKFIKKIWFYIFIISAMAGFMGLMVNAYNIVDKQVVYTLKKNNYTIVLDAGHGE